VFVFDYEVLEKMGITMNFYPDEVLREQNEPVEQQPADPDAWLQGPQTQDLPF
jgi:hypothetical protein